MKSFKGTSLAIVAMATLAIGAVACSKKSSGTPTGTPTPPPQAKKPNGANSNLGCNGTNNDPAATTSSVTITFVTTAQPLSGTPPLLGGVSIATYTLATGTTAGGAAVTTTATAGANLAMATESLTASKRYAFALNAPLNGATTYVPTYQFNSLTPPHGTVGTAATFGFLVIPETIYSAFIGLLNITPTAVAGDMQVAARIVDCDGDPVVNAVVADISNCSAGTFPCAGYFASGTPNSGAKLTDASGQFVVAGVTPGHVYDINLNAVITAGGAVTKIGHLAVYGQPNTVGLGVVGPLGTSTGISIALPGGVDKD